MANGGRESGLDAVARRIQHEALVAWHLENGSECSATEYLFRYKKQLHAGLSGTFKIYLDTNFWIWLRQAEVDNSHCAFPLLQILRMLVRQRRAICVSHAQSFLELTQQAGDSLRITGSLVDELSEGVTILADSELRFCESQEYVAAKLGVPYNRHGGVWTKIGQVFHSTLPQELFARTRPELARAGLKSMLDFLWNCQLVDLLEQFGWDTRRIFREAHIDAATIEAVTQRRATNLRDGKTRQQLLRENFDQAFIANYRTEFIENVKLLCGNTGAPAERIAGRLLSTAIDDFRRGRMGAFLPGHALPTELYVLWEQDRRRELTTNDWADWRHAAVALPYCDYFFTEGHLAHQLCQVLRADVRYSCTVANSVGSAIDALATL